MPACSQIYLWMETLKYDALNKAAEKNNTTIEALLQPKLEELYCEYVPADLRKQIAEKLADILLEEEKAEHRKRQQDQRGGSDAETEAARNALVLACAVVEAADRLKSLSESCKGGGEEVHYL